MSNLTILLLGVAIIGTIILLWVIYKEKFSQDKGEKAPR